MHKTKYIGRDWSGWVTVMQLKDDFEVLTVKRKGLLLAYIRDGKTQYARIDDKLSRRFNTEEKALSCSMR